MNLAIAGLFINVYGLTHTQHYNFQILSTLLCYLLILSLSFSISFASQTYQRYKQEKYQ